MCDVVLGKTYTKKKKSDEGYEPMKGFHSHKSHNEVFHYVINTDQIMPRYVIHWEAYQSRAGMAPL